MRRDFRSLFLIVFAAFLTVSALRFVACTENPDITINPPSGATGGGGGGGGGTPATISLIASPTFVDLSGTSTITATVRDSLGVTVPDGTLVTFSVPSLGTLAPTTPVPTVNGVATATFTAGTTAGSANISATTGTVTNTVTVTIAPIPASVTLTASPSTITVLGTANLSATVLNSVGGTMPDGTTVTFSISPTSLGTITPAATTSSGIANGTFTAGGTSGSVNVTATAGTASDTVTITIQPVQVGSIQFSSAVPTVVGIKGSGQQETSVITFIVKDVQGTAVPGVSVSFDIIGPNCTSNLAASVTCPNPSTDQNDEFVTPTTASTDSQGRAVTRLQAGKVAGTVRIIGTACVGTTNPPPTCTGGTAISSSSTPLSIGGGVPSMTHFTLSASVFNLAGYQYANEQSTITAFLADRFGNFNVLQGTAISFITSAGAIDRNNVTDATGIAGVIYRTQDEPPIDVDPRDPLNPISFEEYNNFNENGQDFGPVPPADPTVHTNFGDTFFDLNQNGYDLTEPNPRDGRVTVVAFTQGEEKFFDTGDPLGTSFGFIAGNGVFDFIDSNGNGRHDFGEPSENFVDNGGEPFVDANDNGLYDHPELFVDANGDGFYNPNLGETFTDSNPSEPFLDGPVPGGGCASLTQFPDGGGVTGIRNGFFDFTDSNSNDLHDVGEPSECFKDLNGDGFMTGNGVYDPGELFIDVDHDGFWTPGNGAWDANTVIWKPIRLVWSDAPFISRTASRIEIDDTFFVAPGSFAVPPSGCEGFTVVVGDFNLNRLTAGSTVTVASDGGKLLGGGTFDSADGVSTGPEKRVIALCDDDPDTTKLLGVTITVTMTQKVSGHPDLIATMTVLGTIDNLLFAPTTTTTSTATVTTTATVTSTSTTTVT